MRGTGFFQALDRLGLVKYALATLFTALVFILTAGAYLLDEQAKRPPRRKPLPAAWIARQSAPPPPGWIMRAPVVHTVRFAAAATPPAGFAFYDITAAETPQTLADKCTRKQCRLGKVQGEACNFAASLAGPDVPAGLVAAFVRDRGRDCCAVAPNLPHQLATYVFGQGPAKAGTPAEPRRGTAVFSQVGAGLLSLSLRFTDRIDGYAATLARYLDAHCGPSTPLPDNGAAWSRDGGLVILRRVDRNLVVTAYFLANIDRHAAKTRELAANQPAAPQQAPASPTGRLAMANP